MKNTSSPLLIISGIDPSGSAGMAIDIQTATRLHTNVAIIPTCLTVQNQKSYLQSHPIATSIIISQFKAITKTMPIKTAKIGMLYTAKIITSIGTLLKKHKINFVLDPVLVSTTKAPLIMTNGLQALKKYLLPLAAIVTPNIFEAMTLTEIKKAFITRELFEETGKRFLNIYGIPVLIKSGGTPLAGSDLFCSSSGLQWLNTKQHLHIRKRGTGCMLSTAIAVYLSRGKPLKEAIIYAKKYFSRQIYI